MSRLYSFGEMVGKGLLSDFMEIVQAKNKIQAISKKLQEWRCLIIEDWRPIALPAPSVQWGMEERPILLLQSIRICYHGLLLGGRPTTKEIQ